MKIRDVMTRDVWSCTKEQTLNEAARIMWEADVGCVPIVDEERKPVSMLTDRDISMAAYIEGRPLREIPIELAMAKGIFTCQEQAPISDAERTMRDWQIRRLPVTNELGVLVGIVSIIDILAARRAGSLASFKERVLGDVDDTLAAICRRRLGAQSETSEVRHAPVAD
jgi:CBS domain-containing protein